MKRNSQTDIYSNEKIHSYIFHSSFCSINSVEFLLKKLKKQLHIPQRIYFAIWISVNEAFSNAIIHGNKFNPNKKVKLQIQLKEQNKLYFKIKDEGNGFDYENVPNHNQSKLIDSPYGRGVFNMKELAHQISYSHQEREVALCFNLA